MNSSSCIEIRGYGVYFRIENCTCYNSRRDLQGLGPFAGILLMGINNGQLINNNCSFNNGKGIELLNSNNTIVSGNILNNNGDFGLNIHESENNLISENTIKNNGEQCINIAHNSNNNTISKNIINNNRLGMSFYESDYNIVSENPKEDLKKILSLSNKIFSGLKEELQNERRALIQRGNTPSKLTVDIAFCMDCTGSMVPWLEATKVSMRREFVSLAITEGVNVRQYNSRMTRITK